MRRRLEEGARRFVWNLQQLEKLNSITLGVFISSLKTVRDSGGCVVLHSVPAEAKEMLELTQISQYIDIFNTEEEARQHLARRR
jgi:anti-anti-sigma factor